MPLALLAACGTPPPSAPVAVVSKPAEQVRALAAPSVVSLVTFRLDRVSDALLPTRRGSAVAVAIDSFLTDCRNLLGADVVTLGRRGRIGLAFLDSGYFGEDVCLLRSEEIVGIPVRAVRDAANVAAGEQVFAIADPEGRGPVLQPAAVIGKRPGGEAVWLQTTAAIMSGWSGGAVFDVEGNLLGIAMTPTGMAGRQVVTFADDSPLLPTAVARVGADGSTDHPDSIADGRARAAFGVPSATIDTLTVLAPAQRASIDRFFGPHAIVDTPPR